MFKGFNLDAVLFEMFSDLFSNDFMNNVSSGSWRKTNNYSSDGTIQNVAYTYDMGRKTTLVRFEDITEIPEDIRKEIGEAAEELTAGIPLEAGDVAIVCNTRMLHGRRSFTDENRAIPTRMCHSMTW